MSRLLQPLSRLSRPNFGMFRLSRSMSRLSRPNFGLSRLFWSEKLRRLHLALESRAASALVARKDFLVAPSPRWSGKKRPLRLGLKSRNVSTLVWKVAPYPPQSRGILSWSRRLHLGLKNRAASVLARKFMLSLLWSGKSHRTLLSREEYNLYRATSVSI